MNNKSCRGKEEVAQKSDDVFVAELCQICSISLFGKQENDDEVCSECKRFRFFFDNLSSQLADMNDTIIRS